MPGRKGAAATVLLFLLLAAEAGVVSPASGTTPSCIPSADPFSFVGASWGAPSPVSAGPGELDVSLTVSIIYTGGCALTSASFQASFSFPFSVTGGGSTATTYEVNLGTSASLSETYYVNIASDAALGTYSVPILIGYNESDIAGVYSQSVTAVVSLEGAVSIAFSTPSSVLYSGVVNNVTITTTNFGSGAATSVSVSAAAAGQVSILDQLPPLQALGAGENSTSVLRIFVPSSLSGSAVSLTLTAKYYDPLSLSGSASQTLGFYVVPFEPASPFVLEGAQWGTSDLSPQPGDADVPLTVSLQYLGTSEAIALDSQLTLPSGFTDVQGATTSSQYTASVQPDQVVQLTFDVDIGKGVQPGSYNFSLFLSWESGQVSKFTEALTAAPPEVGVEVPTGGTSISLRQVNSTVVSGASGVLAFSVANSGSSSVYSVSISLQPSSPIVVQSGSPSAQVAVLRPGASTLFYVTVGSSPDSSVGAYGGTATVTYSDLDGVQHTVTYTVEFTLTGSVRLVVQDETVSQTSSGLTVSGSLLNEGEASAYYLVVSGSVSGGTGNSTADYVGEVDPNSPTPFTITIPFTAPRTPTKANVTVVESYQDSFGNHLKSSSASPQSLESSSELEGSTSQTTTTSSGPNRSVVTIAFLAIVVIIAIAGVTGGVVVRRRRAAEKPQEPGKVI